MADNPRRTEQDNENARIARRVDQRLNAVQTQREDIDRWLSGNGGIIMLVIVVGVALLFLLSLAGVHI